MPPATQKKTQSLKDCRQKYVCQAFEKNRLVDMLVNFSLGTIVEYDAQTTASVAMRRWSKTVLEYSQSYIQEEDVPAFLETADESRYLNAFAAGGAKRLEAHQVEYRAKKGCAGEAVWRRGSVAPFAVDGELFAYVCIEDIDSYKDVQAQLLFRSEHDSLTEMKNKLSTEMHIAKFLASDTGKNGLHAFFIFDIDNFKSVNSSFGHIFGDVFLARTARKVRELFRDGDVLGRFGGDEFVILMKNLTDKASAFAKAESILNTVREEFVLNEKFFRATISIGIAFFDADGKSYQQLLHEADLAMYHCKNNGKNQFAQYDVEMLKQQFYVPKPAAAAEIIECDINELVFRALAGANDADEGMFAALGAMCSGYDIDNAAIFDLAAGHYAYTYSKTHANGKNVQDFLGLRLADCELPMLAGGALHSCQCGHPVLDAADFSSAVSFVATRKGEPVAVLWFSRAWGAKRLSNGDIKLIRPSANLVSAYYVLAGS